MRDWSKIDRYYNELLGDIYPQPPDEGHTAMAQEVVNRWVSLLTTCHSVLDVGCGEGFMQPMFEAYGITYTGIALGEDIVKAKEAGRNVHWMDFNFLDFPDKSFDLVCSRHSLEHSPFPLISLMEFQRVSVAWLLLILPTPKYFMWGGRNHYGMMSASQARFLLERAGWHLLWEDMSEEREFRFMCQKYDRIALLNDSTEEYERKDNNADSDSGE